VASITIKPTVVLDPPQVRSVVFNQGVGIFNTLNHVQVYFSQDVKIGDQSLVLFNTTTGQRYPTSAAALTIDHEKFVADWDTTDLPLPTTGRYQVLLQADAIFNHDGVALVGNGDGKPGGNYASTDLFTLTWSGDTDLDLDVDFSDFLVLAANYGKVDTVWAQANFDLKGGVDFGDFLLLARNYGIRSGSDTAASVVAASAIPLTDALDPLALAAIFADDTLKKLQ
jgi:hypothetical protein